MTSNDSQSPERSETGDLNDSSEDFMDFDKDDLWELDENPAETQQPSTQSGENYSLMDKPEASVDLEIPPTRSENKESASGIFSRLSKVERSSLLGIAIALIVFLTLIIIHFTKEIPVNSDILKKVSLPVKGEILSVSSVETYWRAPVTQGDNPDITQRGVILIPVIKIQASGTSGAVRIFFRDSDGILVGDSTTLPISGDETLTIPATDGFTDVGMHASYRTNEYARWIVQVLEGPSVNAPIEKFKNLFNTEISTEIR
jgi:hypothetical protein